MSWWEELADWIKKWLPQLDNQKYKRKNEDDFILSFFVFRY